ncbi:MAG: PIN domain-containing protein, partial [Chloroflexota bacterium]|nr:PIN domain-containing protein [Chloroflexota bacterium]
RVLDGLRSPATYGSVLAAGANLPDPDDLPFLEVALTSQADVLVTGNSKHFPTDQCHGIEILSPAAGVAKLRGIG